MGLYDGYENMIQARQLTYDDYGNVVYEVLEGNLTGASQPKATVLPEHSYPILTS